MRNLQIIGNVPQVRRENNFGEYAEEAVIIEEQPKVKKENPHFLEANTMEVTMQHLKEDCIIPVFAKDNELTIPHPAFIDTVYDAANTFFSGESIDKPDIRVSHVIKVVFRMLSINLQINYWKQIKQFTTKDVLLLFRFLRFMKR